MGRVLPKRSYIHKYAAGTETLQPRAAKKMNFRRLMHKQGVLHVATGRGSRLHSFSCPATVVVAAAGFFVVSFLAPSRLHAVVCARLICDKEEAEEGADGAQSHSR